MFCNFLLAIVSLIIEDAVFSFCLAECVILEYTLLPTKKSRSYNALLSMRDSVE